MQSPLPELPDTWQPLGNRFSRWLGRSVFKLLGWHCEGELPNIKQLVMAGGPHTSNWDFILALSGILGVGARITWLGKKSIFWGPFDRLLRAAGGLAVDRESPVGLVDQVVQSYKDNAYQVVAILPEGTRRKVTRWKTGFLRIAYKAEVPVLMVSFDYPRKCITFGPLLSLSGDESADLATVQAHIGRVTGKKFRNQ